MISKIVTLLDEMWGIPSRFVGRLLNSAFGWSTITVGATMIMIHYGLLIIRTIRDGDWFWVIVGTAFACFFIRFILATWMRDLLTYDEGDVLPAGYLAMYGWRRLVIALNAIMVVLDPTDWGYWARQWFLIGGCHIAMMMWPKRKNFVSRWLENRPKRQVLTPIHVTSI